MTVLRKYNNTTSQWEVIFSGGDGPTGPTGFIAQATTPDTTDVLWLDTDEPAPPVFTLDIIDAKGDLIVGSAADTVIRLPIGTNGQALVADSAETGGVRWGNVTSSGEDDQIVIATRMFT